MIRICFHTLGCKVNRYESESLSRLFEREGFLCCGTGEDADVHVVNSCTVTAQSDRKTRSLLRRLRREQPEAVLVLTGCYPQAFPAEAAALTEADVVTGSRDRAGLAAAVNAFLATRERVVRIRPHSPGEAFEGEYGESGRDRTRAFLKIEDGCENYCAYCVIPFARGPVRSKPMEELARELARAAGEGRREAVLLGINLASYGRDTGFRLPDAVTLACATPGIERVRLGSMEPDLLTDHDILHMAGEPKLCPQFHLSLQSGSDGVLSRMGRRYTAAQYLSLCEKLRDSFPDAAVTTDMMVGFPGETDAEFAQSLDLARQAGFAKIHPFIYSPRPGTRAADMDGQVTSQVKKQRMDALLALGGQLRERFLQSMVGRPAEVLFEGGSRAGVQSGYTRNYTPVSVVQPGTLRGKIETVLLTQAEEDGCFGIILT